MKRAIVTGGTKGIGLAIVKMLLGEGYAVTATYAHDEEAAQSCAALGVETLLARQDDKASMRAFALRMKERGTIDCLVLNAGGTLRKGLAETSDEEWERVMQVNVNAPVFLLRDLLPVIPPCSRIVFIGSEMALYPHGTSLAYGVAKSAVHALARNLVKTFEATGTTVNVVAPGFVETEWQKEKPQAVRDNICRKTALGRFATVEEVADAVRFCLNNAFVNGSVIEVSGGYCYK